MPQGARPHGHQRRPKTRPTPLGRCRTRTVCAHSRRKRSAPRSRRSTHPRARPTGSGSRRGLRTKKRQREVKERQWKGSGRSRKGSEKAVFQAMERQCHTLLPAVEAAGRGRDCTGPDLHAHPVEWSWTSVMDNGHGQWSWTLVIEGARHLTAGCGQWFNRRWAAPGRRRESRHKEKRGERAGGGNGRE